MINLQATSCTSGAPGTLIKLFAGCQTQAGRWAELSGWISVCPLATLLLNGRNTHREVFSSLNHSRVLWRGNDVPGAGWSQPEAGWLWSSHPTQGMALCLGFYLHCLQFLPKMNHFFLFFKLFLKRSHPFPFNKFSWPPVPGELK